MSKQCKRCKRSSPQVKFFPRSEKMCTDCTDRYRLGLPMTTSRAIYRSYMRDGKWVDERKSWDWTVQDEPKWQSKTKA